MLISKKEMIFIVYTHFKPMNLDLVEKNLNHFNCRYNRSKIEAVTIVIYHSKVIEASQFLKCLVALPVCIGCGKIVRWYGKDNFKTGMERYL